MLLLDIQGANGWSVPALDQVVNETITWTVLVGVFLATSFVSLKFAWEYWRYSVGAMQGNSALYVWDWNEVIRVIFIVMLIAMYKPISSGFTNTIGYINSITQPNSANHEQLKKTANKWYINSKTAKDHEEIAMLRERKNEYHRKGDKKTERALDDQLKRRKILANEHYEDVAFSQNGSPEGGENMKDKLMNRMENVSYFDPSAAIESAASGITLIIGMAIKWAVGTFYSVLFKIGLAFGPIVLAFGIFFREKPIGYFNQLLNVGLTFTTINIVDMIFFKYIIATFDKPSATGAIAFNMALIGCYWSVGKMTRWYVGETGINSIMSRGLGTATSLVVGALAATGMIASAGAGAATAGASGSSGGGLGSAVSKGANAAAQGVSRSGNKRVD